MVSKKRVGILACTGTVGQRFVEMLHNHPWFEVTTLMASERSAGEQYKKTVTWLFSDEIPGDIGDIVVEPTDPKKAKNVDLVFSALPSAVAKTVEKSFAEAGFPVVSNASAFRMDEDVPLIVSEINSDHLAILDIQKERRNWTGCIATDPNCTTIPFAIVLKPILDAFGIRSVFMTSMQALSGAGFPGVASLSIHDNVIPYIGGEEEKVMRETLKVLGKLTGAKVENANFKIAASCNRVSVVDGHLESVFIQTAKEIEIDEVKSILSQFKGLPQELQLPTAPKQPIIVREEVDRPQPRLDRLAGDGMSITVGRIRKGIDDYSLLLTLLGHNTLRGAAGAALLIAETMTAKNLL
ncbi:MAG: aspartate-semialdehyde dehydrogenase [Promethearchaeota archaeon]